MNSETAKIPLPLDILVPRKTVRGPYKTLYLLHDLAGNNTQWMRATQIEALMEGDRTVLVMPSCLNSFYVNMYYGSDFLDYITQELVYLCGSWLSLDQRREKRVIAGIGMGGYGALSAALRAPGVFGAAYSIDGLLQPGRFYDHPLPGLKMEDLFGPQGYYEQSPNQLVNAAEQMKRNPMQFTERFFPGRGGGIVSETCRAGIRDAAVYGRGGCGTPSRRESEGIVIWHIWKSICIRKC